MAESSPQGRIAGTPSEPIKQVGQPTCAALTFTAATRPSQSTGAILTAVLPITATFRPTTIVRPFMGGVTVLGGRRSYIQVGAGTALRGIALMAIISRLIPFIPRQRFG